LTDGQNLNKKAQLTQR